MKKTKSKASGQSHLTHDLFKIKPLFDNVLVKPLEAEEKTASGILLPDTVKEKPQTGLVMAIGSGATNDEGKFIPMVVRPGQKVMYKKWGGNEVKVKGEEWMLVEQKDILAIVE
ncbi:MAG: co-chaperone GroES [Patescibacteria group bacterium]|nr:co-chaperone GroES [Patescibacteria group bacterium]